jgi:hypothetical protein
VDDQRLFERTADAPPQIERRRRILMHVMDVAPGDAGALGRKPANQPAVKTDLAAGHICPDRKPAGGTAAARRAGR